MTNKKSARIQPVPKDLRGSFESAVRDLRQAGLTGKISERRTPIAQRSRSLAESEINVEKRALSDAARALASLWKVSRVSSR
jgi:hypothetical protein